MGLKTFRELGSLKLISDERDVMVSARYRTAVLDWCRENHIEVEPALGIAQSVFGVDLWRVRDERQRVAFVLRWA